MPIKKQKPPQPITIAIRQLRDIKISRGEDVPLIEGPGWVQIGDDLVALGTIGLSAQIKRQVQKNNYDYRSFRDGCSFGRLSVLTPEQQRANVSEDQLTERDAYNKKKCAKGNMYAAKKG